MNSRIDRRRFLEGAAAGAALGAGLARPAAAARAQSPNEKAVVGVMGMGGRGTGLATTFHRQPNVEVAYVCDPDRKRAESAAAAVARLGTGTPRALTDFRRILDDRDVDMLVIATCNHWHAPATILGCAAGKHVYVEKPCSHNPREGELMVAAARKYKRVVQHGTQRRSWPTIREAMARLHTGAIGRVYFARAWYTNDRPSIGRGKSVPIPEGLDYELWQGPAPRRSFRDNYLHYNWHWFWHWGNGELGNNGVHSLDLCRWGMGVDYPVHVTSSGGRYRFLDDQETPDTHVVSFAFEKGALITWEGLSCNRLPQGHRGDVLFEGEKGSLTISGSGYVLHEPDGKPIETVAGNGGDAVHVAAFLDAVRSGSPPTAEIEEGHRSTLLCHLGNIAHRTGRALRCDPKNGRVKGDGEAMQLWSRAYERGWEPRV